VTKWLDPLRAAVRGWRALWHDKARRTAAVELIMDAEEGIVCDSRSGSMVRHRLSRNAVTVLKRLDVPATRAQLVETTFAAASVPMPRPPG